MKDISNLRITIIGFGNLVESLWPNLAKMVGQEHLRKQVNATTADEADIDRKRKQYKIDVLLKDNLVALEKMAPDIILFAPPPTVAPDIIKGDLKYYFEKCRSKLKPLPEIYAFPPVPLGTYYQKVLGKDVLVVNIIPTPFRVIGGKPISGEGFYVLTFPSPWPEMKKSKIRQLFHSHGAGIELKPHQLIDMLGGATTTFAITQALLYVSDVLYEIKQQIGHGRIGEYLRARAQAHFNFYPAESDPCKSDAIVGPLTATLDSLFASWHQGIHEYYREVAFPAEATKVMLVRNFDLALHITQIEPREIIHQHLVVAATKGGVLERALEISAELTSEYLREAIMILPHPPDKAWCSDIRKIIRETAHAVREHGQTLAG